MTLWTILSLCMFFAILTIFTVLKMNKINLTVSSPFECGFDTNHNISQKFSLRFFSLSIIFLIFDLEIMFIFCICLTNTTLVKTQWVIFSALIFILLILGTLIEWNQNMFYWK